MDHAKFIAGLRERLGVTDAALSDEQLLAAVDEALAEQADTTDTATNVVPDGAIVVDKGAYEQLKSNAAAGRSAMDAIDKTRRDGIITAALRDGRITTASKDGWRAQLDKDEQGISGILDSMPVNTAVPVIPIGHSDTLTSADDALYGSVYGTDEKKEA